jgi:hypothetical protein
MTELYLNKQFKKKKEPKVICSYGTSTDSFICIAYMNISLHSKLNSTKNSLAVHKFYLKDIVNINYLPAKSCINTSCSFLWIK